MRSLVLFLFISVFQIAYGQNKLRVVIKDSLTHETLPGANAVIKGTSTGASSDLQGIVSLPVPDSVVVVFSSIGYENVERTFRFPADTSLVTIYLFTGSEKLDEIIVEGTRSNRSIDRIPTRVEVLTEEIDEATTMDPSKIAHLLTHSTGIQVQQTSATSNMANVRIQGLDGRYTQILKDGFPNYGGFSGSLSIMQIPPLDLRQVEYIKGSASTLYGAGAIAGLINLISKEADKEETILHLNASHIGAFDVNTFVSRRFKKTGFTLLAQRNTHKIFDADRDGFSDMPALEKYNINPKVFLYFSDKTRMTIGGTFTSEERKGGDLRVLNEGISDSVHFYNEINDIRRYTSQVKFEHELGDSSSLIIRNSFNFFDRSLNITPYYLLGNYQFAGKQLSSFSEVSYVRRKVSSVLITGLNFYSDEFMERPMQSLILRNESYQTLGAFINYTFDLNDMVSNELGLRADHVFEKGTYLLPRISSLIKWTEKLSTRVGGGMGYRNASIFNQEAELLAFRNVLPVNKSITGPERSYGANADVGFKTPLGDNFFLNINQMFFFNYIKDPLILTGSGASSALLFINADGFTRSYGAETFFKFGFYDFVFFAGYTYTNATNFIRVESELSLTPEHSLKGDLLYSLPGKWRIGVDYEFKSRQLLVPGKYSKPYWTYGALVEYTYRKFTLFMNVENFTDVRQTRFESLISLPFNTPQFTPVWAPLDGIVVNGGIKVKL